MRLSPVHQRPSAITLNSVRRRKSNFYHDLTPFTCFADADSRTGGSGFERTGHTVSYVTTTKTEVTGRQGPDVWNVEEFTTARDSTAQLGKAVSTISSLPSSGQQRYEVQSSGQGGVVQRGGSFYQETPLHAVAEAGQNLTAVETRRFSVSSKPTYNSALDKLLHIQRLHREEKDQILDFVKVDYDGYKSFYEEQFEAFQTENGRLVRELSASASQITLLKIQLSSRGDGHPRTASEYDKVDSNTTTMITTVTTTITTVTTRIGQWKNTFPRNNGQISISIKELEQLLLDMSTTSSQITELQQNYAELSRGFSSVRYELQVTLSLREEQGRTIATLTAEVAQLKNADAAKAQEIATVRRENEILRRDLSAASSRTTELQLV